MLALQKTSWLIALSALLVAAMIAPTQAATTFYSDRATFEAVASTVDTVLSQGFEGEVWDGGDQVPPGFGWYGWYVPYYSGGVYPNGQQPPIPASAGLATTDAVTVGSYNHDQRNSLNVYSSSYPGPDYGSGNYVMWAKLPDIPNPDGQQNYLRIGLSPGSSAVGMDFMGEVTVEVKVLSGTTLLDTQTVVVDPARSFVGFTSDADAITNIEVRLVGETDVSGFMDNLTWGSPGATTVFYSDREAFETDASEDHTVLAQGFEGEVWDGGDQVPPGFGWYGWYVPYYGGGVYPNGQQPPIPASAGVATADVVTVGSYNHDQRNSLSVFSSTYGSDYGSGNYVMWAKVADIPNPDGQQNYLNVVVNPGSVAVGMDFLGGTTVELKAFSGTTLLGTRTIAVDPIRSFAGFISNADAITNIQVRLGDSSIAGFMDNLTWGSVVMEQVEIPAFTPPGSSYLTPQSVTIACATEGAAIYYTTDQSNPTESSTPYDGTPISIGVNTTLKARAFKTGMTPSDIKIANYRFPSSLNRPNTIPYSNSITVDGNLSDWAGSEWVPLTENYDGNPVDIVAPDTVYAAKWKEDKVYMAVKVRDTAHFFTNEYQDWNVRDAVELYIHTTGDRGTDYATTQNDAQEYTIGFKTGGSGLWSSVGYNPPDGNPIPTGAFQAAGTIDGEWLYYEAALTPYHYFSIDGIGLEPSLLSSGQVISIDAVAVSRNLAQYTGMKCENALTGKSANIANIGLHLLVSGSNIADAKTVADGAAVSVSGIVSAVFTGYFYIEDIDRTYGIYVEKSNHGHSVGQGVSVTGITDTLDCGERYIIATQIVENGSGSIEPLGVTNKALGGGDFGTAPNYQVGVEGGTGLNNIGLLITTTGTVGATGTGWFMIDDGSGVSVKVMGTLPSGATYVTVTGISSCEKNAAIVDRMIRAVSVDKVQP